MKSKKVAEALNKLEFQRFTYQDRIGKSYLFIIDISGEELAQMKTLKDLKLKYEKFREDTKKELDKIIDRELKRITRIEGRCA